MQLLHVMLASTPVKSIAIGAIIMLIVCFLISLIVVPFLKGKRLEKAKKEGRVIKAQRIDVVYSTGKPSEKDAICGIYQFEYNGKSYKYRGRYYEFPPYEETLYFRKGPRWAKGENSFGGIENEWIYIWLYCSLVTFVLLSL